MIGNNKKVMNNLNNNNNQTNTKFTISEIIKFEISLTKIQLNNYQNNNPELNKNQNKPN